MGAYMEGAPFWQGDRQRLQSCLIPGARRWCAREVRAGLWSADATQAFLSRDCAPCAPGASVPLALSRMTV
jgi:hypothetical protein